MGIFTRAARLAAICLLLAGTLPAFAGGFQVSPVVARIPPGNLVASFKLGNPGDEPVTIQVDVLSWDQDEQGEHYAPASDALVAPRVVTLAPRDHRLVRVAMRGTVSGERAYRVHFREVPPPLPEGFVGVRTLIKQDVPLIFLAAGSPDMAWRATLAPDGQLLVSGTNAGNRYFTADQLKAVDEAGRVLADHRGALHLLAGRSARWPMVTHADLKPGDRLRLQFAGKSETHHVALSIE